MSVADVFDALTSRRPYKKAWPVEKALAMMESQSGRQFDPDVLDAFIRALPRILEVHERFKASAVDDVYPNAVEAGGIPETVMVLATASA